jgi:glycosyltransferase involved in cell wall biosynthesis
VKIVQAVPWYFPDSLGGTEIYVRALAGWLASRGHEVMIAAPKAGLSKPEDYVHAGQHVFRYPIPEQPTREETQELRRTRGTEWFDAELLRFRPDVVHFHTLGTGLGLSEARSASKLGARVILTSHSSTLGYTCQRGSLLRWGAEICDGIAAPRKCAACALQHRGMPRKVAQIFALFPAALSVHLPGPIAAGFGMPGVIRRNSLRQNELFSLLSAFVVLTEWARQILIANGAPAEKVVLNRLGISHAPAPRMPRPVHKPIRVGYLGRFEDIKGVLELGAAFATLPKSLPIALEFRGPVRDEADRRILGELKSIIGADARVTFAPAVPSEEVPSILSTYDVLCCPSLCLEGGPTVALEAFAVGVPVIGTDLGGLAEIVQHDRSGWLFPPGDRSALAAILRRLASEGDAIVPQWRAQIPTVRTMAEVAADYLPLYEPAALERN